ncbi:lipopolysaccharide biosynthesis protein [Engelhardtia mirabilis]|uniref:Uncharacterized protein n=1 Tax=Engelhardtia mirabilis TaxID=2528011 RepID=A0A518BRW5_9BACT|nr:hypothetical protein Pla133_48320 [Planctomycetes bacterium Pla133]QDV04037.1 hypothetical protein Pla86_48300 [Planctomycetes bacterium Pla86]
MSDGPPTAKQESGSLGSLLRHSLNYSLVPVVGRVISVVMIAFYTRWFDTDEYGTVDLADLLLAGLVQFIGWNLLSGMQRFYFERTDQRERNAVVSSCAILLTAVGWTVVGALLMFRHELAPILISTEGSANVSPSQIVDVATVALLIVPLQLSSQAGFFYLQIQKQSGLYAKVALVKLVFELSLRIWFLFGLEWGPVGYLLPVLIGEGLCTIFLTGHVLWRVGLAIHWDILRPIVAYSLPLIPVGVFQLGLHYGDRRMLDHFAASDGLDQVGIYGLGYKLGFLVTMAMLGPFVQIFHPWLYSEQDPQEQAKKVARVSTYGLVAMSAASLLVILFGKQGIDLLASQAQYLPAWRVVPLITVGYTFWAVYHITQIPLYIAKDTFPLMWINAAALLLNVLLNWWLVPRYGFVGSGWATLVTFAALAAGGMFEARRVMSVPFELRRLSLTVGAVAAAAAAALELDANLPVATIGELALAVALKGAIAITLLAGLWAVVLERDERSQVTAWARARLGRGGERAA